MAKTSIPGKAGKPSEKISSPYPMVRVLWVDAVSEDKWQDVEEAKDSFMDDWNVQSIGYLIKNEPEDSYIVLGGSVGLEGDVCMTLKVPRGMIKEITHLSRKGSKKVRKPKPAEAEGKSDKKETEV